MTDNDWLARQFEANRGHLREVAYRMLGSLPEADDAVQEAWLRLSRSEASDIANLGGWLTTVTARVCLDMLRARESRREESLEAALPEVSGKRETRRNPEEETLLAESVGLAMLVVLQTLPPPERLAFVLHDMFGVPFDEIASIVGRSATATRQLASRARRRVKGADTSDLDRSREREVVDAYLAATRNGDIEGLVAVLAPDVVVTADNTAIRAGASPEVRGARNIAQQALTHRARFAQVALIDGAPGLVVAPRGRLMMVIAFKISDGRITSIDVIADPSHLSQLEIAVAPD